MNSPGKVKICGNTNLEDVALAARVGADYIGVIVDFPPSPRNVSIETARKLRAATHDYHSQFALVTVNLTHEHLLRLQNELAPDVFQLHGNESAEFVAKLKESGATVWTAVHDAVRANELLHSGADALLVDARIVNESGTIYGGTGQLSDWNLARELKNVGAKVILAGGLTPENVTDAIRDVKPWAVDAISGVEYRKGIKDSVKVVDFIASARSAFDGNS